MKNTKGAIYNKKAVLSQGNRAMRYRALSIPLLFHLKLRHDPLRANQSFFATR